jgi:AraC family ethanolamine operon transcriptional activator
MDNIYTFRMQSHDFDEISASLDRWHQSYRQLSAGAFQGDIRYAYIDGVELFELYWGQIIQYQGITPPGSIGFGLPLNLIGESLFLNHRINDCDLLIQRSGQEGDLIGSQHFRIHVLTIDEQHFFEKVRLLTGVNVQSFLRSINTIALEPTIAAMLRNKFQKLIWQANDDSVDSKTSIRKTRNIAYLAEDIIEYIAAIVTTGHHEQPRLRLMRQRELVKKTKEIILSQPSIVLRTHDLCAILATSERTLRDAFRVCTGISATAYLKAFRLNQVRAILKSTSPANAQIQDVAFNWGFHHMGQFSADYKRLFGESPSQTLHHV